MPGKKVQIQDAVLGRIISNLRNPNINWTPLSAKFARFLESPDSDEAERITEKKIASPTAVEARGHNEESEKEGDPFMDSGLGLSPMSVSSFYAETPETSKKYRKKDKKTTRNNKEDEKKVRFTIVDGSESYEIDSNASDEKQEEEENSITPSLSDLESSTPSYEPHTTDGTDFSFEISSDGDVEEDSPVRIHEDNNCTKNTNKKYENDKKPTIQILSPDYDDDNNDDDSSTPSLTDSEDDNEYLKDNASGNISKKENDFKTLTQKKQKAKRRKSTKRSSVRKSSTSKSSTVTKQSQPNDNDIIEDVELISALNGTPDTRLQPKKKKKKTSASISSKIKKTPKTKKNKRKTPVVKRAKSIEPSTTTKEEHTLEKRGCDSVYDISEETSGQRDEFCLELNYLKSGNIKGDTITKPIRSTVYSEPDDEYSISNSYSETTPSLTVSPSITPKVESTSSNNDKKSVKKKNKTRDVEVEEEKSGKESDYSISDNNDFNISSDGDLSTTTTTTITTTTNSNSNNDDYSECCSSNSFDNDKIKSKKPTKSKNVSISITNSLIKDSIKEPKGTRRKKKSPTSSIIETQNNNPKREYASELPVSPENYHYKKFSKERLRISQEVYEAMKVLVFKNHIPHLGEVVYIQGPNGGLIECISSIQWNANLKKAAGRCTSSISKLPVPKEVDGQFLKAIYKADFVIELSTKYLDCYKRLLQTLGHEMCHLAVFLDNPEQLSSKSKHHGLPFKQWAAKVEHNTGVPIHIKHDYKMFYTHRWQCKDCGCIYGRFSRSINIDRQRCGRCGGELVFLGVFEGNSEYERRRAPRE